MISLCTRLQACVERRTKEGQRGQDDQGDRALLEALPRQGGLQVPRLLQGNFPVSPHVPWRGRHEDVKMGAPPHPETHRKAVTRSGGTTGHRQSPASMPRSCRAESLFSRQPPALLQGGRVGEKMGAAPPEPTHSGAASRAALRPAP